MCLQAFCSRTLTHRRGRRWNLNRGAEGRPRRPTSRTTCCSPLTGGAELTLPWHIVNKGLGLIRGPSSPRSPNPSATTQLDCVRANARNELLHFLMPASTPMRLLFINRSLGVKARTHCSVRMPCSEGLWPPSLISSSLGGAVKARARSR